MIVGRGELPPSTSYRYGGVFLLRNQQDNQSAQNYVPDDY